MMLGMASSTRSYVVKRFSQARQRRRRRIVAPSSEARESITCVSAFWQKGQRNSVSLVYATLRVARALGRIGLRIGLRAAGRPILVQRHAKATHREVEGRSCRSGPGEAHGARVYAAVRTRHAP